METKLINTTNAQITEIISPEVLIHTEQDALDIIGNTTTDYVIMHAHHFEKTFFDLKTRILGEVLQKFTNYRIKLAIVGDFTQFPSKTLKAFIYESNRHGHYLFLPTIEAVIKRWTS